MYRDFNCQRSGKPMREFRINGQPIKVRFGPTKSEFDIEGNLLCDIPTTADIRSIQSICVGRQTLAFAQTQFRSREAKLKKWSGGGKAHFRVESRIGGEVLGYLFLEDESQLDG